MKMLIHLFSILFQKVTNYKTGNQLIVVLVLINFLSCTSKTQDKKVYTNDIRIKDTIENSKKIINYKGTNDEKLVFYYKKAIGSKGKIKVEYEKLFFNAFPSSFNEMKEIFGYVEKKEGLLYDYEKGEKILLFFENLKSIDREKYYNKYIDICIGGKYEADLISNGFGLDNIIISNKKDIIPLLAKRSDDEIISVFYFILDEPIPNKDFFSELYIIVKSIDLRVSELMKEAFKEVSRLTH